MREGELPVFSDRGSSNKIIVSQSIADKLRLKPGDRIFAYFFDGEAVRTRRFSVSGIYETNLSQYDDMVCFTDLYTILKINGLEEDQAFGAELSVTDFNKLDETKENVVKRISQAADRNGNIYSAQTIR